MPKTSAPSVRRSFPRDWVDDVLKALSSWVPVDQLCRDVGLEVGEGPARIPCEVVLRALDRAAEVSGDTLLGLHLAERLRPRGVLAYLVRVQRTLREAIAHLVRFQHLIYANPSVVVVGGGGSARLIFFWPEAGTCTRQLVEFCLAMVHLEGTRSVAPAVRLAEIRFRHAAAGVEREYQRVFESPVLFGQPEDALLFPCSALSHRMRGTNPTVAALTEQAARSQHEIAGDVPSCERVALAVRSLLLSTAGCEQETVCTHLGVSRRTLQRRLWREQTSFSAVRNEAQKRVALDLLTLPTLAAVDIQRHSGFPTLDALDHALRRWTGRPLSAHRSPPPPGDHDTPP